MNIVDTVARREMANAVRAFATGQITNFEFEGRVPDSHDPVIDVADHYVWCLYSDFKQHRAIGRHRLDPTTRAEVARLILFLQSDRSYLWPDNPQKPSLLWSMVGLGRPMRRWRKATLDFLNTGDMAAWPFENRSALNSEVNRRRSGMI